MYLFYLPTYLPIYRSTNYLGRELDPRGVFNISAKPCPKRKRRWKAWQNYSVLGSWYGWQGLWVPLPPGLWSQKRRTNNTDLPRSKWMDSLRPNRVRACWSRLQRAQALETCLLHFTYLLYSMYTQSPIRWLKYVGIEHQLQWVWRLG